ncbi:hypothetical protein AB4K20DRAFT_1904023 [Rhizopus microsporus]
MDTEPEFYPTLACIYTRTHAIISAMTIKTDLKLLFMSVQLTLANAYLPVSHFICMSKYILDFLLLLFCFMRLYVLAVMFQFLKYFTRSRDDDIK